MFVPVEALADPESPINLAGLIGANGAAPPARRRLRALAKLGVAVAAVTLVLLLWRYTALQELTRPGALEGLMADIAEIRSPLPWSSCCSCAPGSSAFP